MDIPARYLAKKVERNTRILVAGLIFWVLPGMSLPANDDYLSILEAEAGSTDAGSGVSTAAAGHKQPAKLHYAEKSDVIQSGLDFGGFEEELGSNYSGSHFLYEKLSKRNRRRVYDSYREDNRISAIREEIIRLLSSG